MKLSSILVVATVAGCSAATTKTATSAQTTSDKPPALSDHTPIKKAMTPPSAAQWTPLTSTWSPDAHIMLLTDGTVLGFAQDGSVYRFAPDSNGSYAASEWSAVAAQHNSRLYFGSRVLPDGRVVVVGAEYGTGTGNGEVYDPVANTWTTPFSTPSAADTETALMPDGRVYIAWTSQIYDPATDKVVAGPTYPKGLYDEAGFVLLADQTYLTIPANATTAYRYRPALGDYVTAGTLPAGGLYSSGQEIGPGLRLADGTVLWIGANGKTAIYTAPVNTNDPGSWAAGPDVPGALSADDSAGAVLPNGNVIFVADKGNYVGPATVFGFDTTNKTIAALDGAPSPSVSYVCRMVVLPTGQIMLSTGGNGYLYTPDGSPDPKWKPTISGITAKGKGVYELSGTQLYGYSEGSTYGDDSEMSSNFPLVRLEGGGSVTYGRTFGWSPAVLGLGTAAQTTQLSFPVVPDGMYSLVVVVNGIASDPLPVTMTGNNLITNDFQLSNAQTLTVQTGSMATAMVATTKVAGGAEPVALTASALPAGLTATLMPTSITSDKGTTMVTVAADPTAALGMTKLTVTGTGSTVTRTSDITINVVSPPDMTLLPDMTILADMTVPPDMTQHGGGGSGGTGGGGTGGSGGGTGGGGPNQGNGGAHGGCSCDIGGGNNAGAGGATIALLLFALFIRARRRAGAPATL